MPPKRRRSRSPRRRSKSRRRSSRRRRVRGQGSCPPGQVMRKGYTRRSASGKRTRVPPSCIKDLGAPGKGPKLWTVTPGLLGQYGYKLHESAQKRRAALKRSVINDGYATTVRRLNAVANYVHRTEPQNYKTYRSDMKWIKKDLGGYSRSASRKRSKSKKRGRRSRSRKRSASRRRSRRRRSKSRRRR